MEGQLNQAFHLVSQPNTQAIKEGENLLQHLKKNSQYPLALLHYINQSNTPEVGKLRAAIELKLWCQHYQALEEFQRNFYAQTIEDIKQNLLMAYLTFPLKISKTLRSGLVALAQLLFPRQWPDLMTNLLLYVNQNPGSTMAVLKLIQSVSHKYSYEARSDPLYEEIIQVCNQVHDYLLNLTLSVLQRVQQNPEAVNDVVMLEVLMKIFYNLNYQDLHPKFEDHIQPWMGVIKTIMGLHNSNENIFKCKGATLEAILLYASKYKEDVQDIIQGFCSEIWQLCSGASEDPEYDSIVFNSLKFFKSLLLWQEMQPFFREHMAQLFENLIMPNIGINKAHVALFEDEIELYIDYYFRNTQIQTRRAAALELLRVVCRHYKIIEDFLQQQLQNFQGVSDNVQAECTLLTLIIEGANKGFRDVDGCTQLFVREEIIQYTYNSVVKKTLFNMYEWLNKHPEDRIQCQFNVIHVATIIRFLFYFRIYFPKEELSSLLQFLTTIKSDNRSLQKVIYLSINGFLVMRHGDFLYFRNLVYFFRGQALKANAVNILKVAYEGTIRQQGLQESLTKMLYNVVRGLGNLNEQFFDYEIEIIKKMLEKTKVYDFSSVQYLFEAIGELSYQLISCNSSKQAVLQKEVMSYFMEALKNKTDLLNFCLQILSIFLQHQGETTQQYRAIYESLLMTENWREENQSLMSSYIQFLIAFIAKHKQRLIEDKSAIETILSQIIKIDHIELFYRFMEAIMLHTTLEEFFQSGYLQLVVQAGQATAQTISGRKASLIFLCKMIVNYDPVEALRLLNQCCGGYFEQLLEASRDILKTLSQRPDRKWLFGGVCRAIQCNYFQNVDLLGEVMNCLIINTVERFNFRNITEQMVETQVKEKKESTYKKLQVFREFEKQNKELDINEEEVILNTFKYVSNAFPDIINFIEQRNRERLMRLNDKYQK